MATVVARLFDVLRGFVLHAVKHPAAHLSEPTIELEVASNLGDALLLGA